MEKKEYIQPVVLEVDKVCTTRIICGSGGSAGTLPSGGSGDKPTQGSDGNYHAESKDFADFDDEDDY